MLSTIFLIIGVFAFVMYIKYSLQIVKNYKETCKRYKRFTEKGEWS